MSLSTPPSFSFSFFLGGGSTDMIFFCYTLKYISSNFLNTIFFHLTSIIAAILFLVGLHQLQYAHAQLVLRQGTTLERLGDFKLWTILISSDCLHSSHGTDSPVRLHNILIFCGVSKYEADCEGRKPFNLQVENHSAAPTSLLRQLYFQMQSTLGPLAATRHLVWFSSSPV